jgi:hypothetical protein
VKTLITVALALVLQPLLNVPQPHIDAVQDIEKSEQVEIPSYKPYEQEKLASKVIEPSKPKTAPSVPKQATGSEAEAKMFIYMKESGNRPEARNAGGCRGLGQACPGSKLPCSDSDYACQDAWFTNYCISRYGTWVNAKAFWLSHSWW